MGKKARYKSEIDNLMRQGYEAKDIEKMTNIPHATVYRYVDKLRISARHDFNTLMEKDFLFKYNQTLDNYSITIQQCNEQLDKIDKKYDELEEGVNKIMAITPDSKAMTQATLMSQLILLEGQKTTERIRLIQQRDKATGEKAKMYNSGPVVQAIDIFIRSKNPEPSGSPKLNMVETKAIDETQEIPQEDLDLLKKMEEENNDK